MKVPGKNRAVKTVMTFMLKLSLAVFLRISFWMDLSLSAIKLRACKEANIRVV